MHGGNCTALTRQLLFRCWSHRVSRAQKQWMEATRATRLARQAQRATAHSKGPPRASASTASAAELPSASGGSAGRLAARGVADRDTAAHAPLGSSASGVAAPWHTPPAAAVAGEPDAWDHLRAFVRNPHADTRAYDCEAIRIAAVHASPVHAAELDLCSRSLSKRLMCRRPTWTRSVRRA